MSHHSSDSFFRFGLTFELALALVALVVGGLIGVNPWRDLDPTPRGVLIGTVATVPMVLVLLVSDRMPIRPLRRIRQVLEELVLPHLQGRSVGELALLSAAAGLGEESLFRGLLQTGLAGWIGPWPALAVASVVFGVLHAVTPTYAVLASLIGAYLGWIYLTTGDLTVPVVSHGLYDWIALVYFLRSSRAESNKPTDSPVEES